MDRNKLQAKATRSLDQKGNLIINISPRFGKSKVIIDYLNKSNHKKVLITVPRNTIIDSWLTEFDKWNLKDGVEVNIINQRSIAKAGKNYDLVISDEVHSLSENQINELRGFKCKLIGASGSIKPETLEKLEERLDFVEAYRFTVEEAITNGIIANYQIYMVGLELDRVNKNFLAGSKKKPFKTTEFSNNYYLDKDFKKKQMYAFYEKNPVEKKKKNNLAMFVAGKRASCIYQYRSKIEAVKKFLSSQERALVFTARTEVADEFAKSYHSKNKKENNLQKFVDGDINILSVCESVDMGITIPNLKVGIFHQLKSNSESMIQKALRMCNLEEGKTAKIYIFYYQGTQDEKWAEKAIQMLNPKKIIYIDETEINK